MQLNQLLAVTFVIFGFAASSASAESPEDRQHANSLAALSDSVLRDSDLGSSEAGCPKAGSLLVLGGNAHGPVNSSESKLAQIKNGMKSTVDGLNVDQSKCGSCHQVNEVTAATVSRPETEGTDSTCASKGTESARGVFANLDSAKAFAKNMLFKENSDGERLWSRCGKCSFYVYEGQTILPSGKLKLNLNVRCGDQRKSLFSTYSFSGALIHQWNCQKN